MTATQKNNLLYQHLRVYNFINKHQLLAIKVKHIVRAYCPPDMDTVAPLDDSKDKLIDRLRAFVSRHKAEGASQHKVLLPVQRLADKLQSLQTHKTQADLLAEIESLKKQVLSSSPSGHEEMPRETKKHFKILTTSLQDIMMCTGLESVLSQDRIRILRSDLIYLKKREHLFA